MSFFSDTKQIKKHVSVAANLPFDSLAPHVLRAEKEHIRPILGAALFNALLSYVDGGGSGSSSTELLYEELLDYVRPPLASFAVRSYINTEGLALIGDEGVTTRTGENSRQAYKWQVDRMTRELYSNGMRDLDLLLSVLEENAADLADWTGSSSYANLKDVLVYKTSLFEDVYGLNNSRLTFCALKPYLKRAEQGVLVQHISSAFYAELVAEAATNSGLSAKNKLLLPLIQQLVVPATLIDAMPKIRLVLKNDGVVLQQLEVNLEHNETQKTATDMQVASLLRALENDKKLAGKELKAFLEANADDYPTYKASDKYIGESATTLNNGNRGIVHL